MTEKKVKNYFPQIQLAVMKMLAQTPRRKNRGQVICALQALEKEIIPSLCAHLMPDLALSGADTEES